MWIVAEIGSAHRGHKALAHRYIREAASAGATHVKFQLGHPFAYKGPDRELRAVRYSPMEWVDDLNKWCNQYGVQFFASIWDKEALKLAQRVGMWGYKIAYQKNTDYDLIESCMEDGCPVFISGMGSAPAYKIHGISVVSKYPTYWEDLQIPKSFEFKTGKFYGYSSEWLMRL